MRTAVWMSGLVLVAGLAACGEEEPKADPGPTPPDPLGDVPAEPDAGLDDGHWAKEQRGIVIDKYDFAVVQAQDSAAGITAQTLKDNFGHLVLNLQVFDYLRGAAGANACVDPESSEGARPLAAAEAFLEDLREKETLEFDSLVVNVDLTNPKHTDLLYVCGDTPFYGDPTYRASLIGAFEEVARLSNLKYLTVGVELNKYSYFRDADDQPIPEDYVNLATLYREIYAAVKAEAPDVQVGPGFSWDFLMNVSMPATANELGITDNSGIGAWYRAWQRTILPFLVDNGEPGKPARGRSADFVGFTIAPETEADPFLGTPTPLDETQTEEIARFYRYMALAGNAPGGEPLPIGLTQVDWPVQSQALGKQKGAFLRTLKRNVSHVDLAFVAWRRLSDLITRLEGELDPACDVVMEAGYPKEFCNAGLLNVNGERRASPGVPDADAFGVFTENP